MICWINPFTGLAGDMLLGALIDAGAPLPDIRAAIASTGLDGWEVSAERVLDHGLSATRLHVSVLDRETERPATVLIDLASRARPAPVAEVAVAALTAIAETEARLHGTVPDRVHLHELGGHDTLVDIVGTAAALHGLGVTDLVCAPLPLGTGHVATAHGVMPAPAPATLALLTGAAVTGTDLPGETVTPTAAALLTAARARYGPVPPMLPRATGYGAGTRTLADRPNVAVVTLGPAATGREPAESAASVVVLETNLDDVTGETLAHTVERLLAAGALDAWVTPAVMKKGRPAHVLHALADPATAGHLQAVLLAETGSLGVRRLAAERTVLPRAFTVVHVGGCPIRVKHGPHGAKPEHDDVAAASHTLGLPLRTVAARAMLAHSAHPAQPNATDGG
jgi:pyridinium-3,5-bisthiocarboxylic acid mononucleotide nickel chelatase